MLVLLGPAGRAATGWLETYLITSTRYLISRLEFFSCCARSGSNFFMNLIIRSFCYASPTMAYFSMMPSSSIMSSSAADQKHGKV